MQQNLGGGNWRRIRRVFGAALCASACQHGDSPPGGDRFSKAAPEQARAQLANVASVRVERSDVLRESSAAAMSARQGGVLFTINDSGNEPLLFALDTTGADRGVWRVAGAKNIDWEAAAVGPCGARAAGQECVYIGDIGDNGNHHPSRDLYRFAEPAAAATSRARGAFADRLAAIAPDAVEAVRYLYPDHAHDAEAMYVAPDGDVFVITKRAIADGHGRLRPALVFKIPSSAWDARVIATATFVDSLPIVPGSQPFRLVTDASLAPDAKHLAVRTYTELYIFATDSLTGMVKHDVPPRVCDVTTLSEYQGEGVTWVSAGGRFAFTSEGRREPLRLGDCTVM